MKSDTQYIQTEFGEIPDNWEIKKIDDVFDVSAGGDLARLNFSKVKDSKFKYPIYSNTLNNNGLYGFSDKYQFEPECITITARGEVGTAEYRNKPFNAIVRLLVLKPKIKVSCYFVSNFINSGLNFQYVGSAVNQLTAPMIRQRNIVLPPIDEQQQIASVLSSLDDKIELNRRMNKTLEEIGKTLFDQLNEVEDSSAIELKEIVDFNPRESLSKSTEARYFEMKDLPEQGMWIASNIKKPYKGGSKFRNGDILMARITPCLENGKSGFVNSLDDGELAFGSTEFIVLRPKKRMFAEYIYYLVRNELFRRHAIRSMVGSSGRQRVQVDVLKSYKLIFPKYDKLEEFNKSTNTMFEQIKQNSVEIELLSQIRDKLLPRLMSGKIRVTV